MYLYLENYFPENSPVVKVAGENYSALIKENNIISIFNYLTILMVLLR